MSSKNEWGLDDHKDNVVAVNNEAKDGPRILFRSKLYATVVTAVHGLVRLLRTVRSYSSGPC